MADVTLYYKGNNIFETSSSGSKNIKTAGKYCEEDIALVYDKPAPALSPLSNPATVSDIMVGKKAYNDSGVELVGTLDIFLNGSFSDLCNMLTDGWNHTEFSVPSDITSALTINHTLGSVPTCAIVYPKTDFLNAFIGMAYNSFDNSVNNRCGNLASINGNGLYKMFATRMQSTIAFSDPTTNNVKIASSPSATKVAGTYILAVK